MISASVMGVWVPIAGRMTTVAVSRSFVIELASQKTGPGMHAGDVGRQNKHPAQRCSRRNCSSKLSTSSAARASDMSVVGEPSCKYSMNRSLETRTRTLVRASR